VSERARTDIAGLVLAGGKATRLGGEKAFRLLRGRPLIAHAMRPLAGLAHMAVSANAERERYAPFAPVLITDEIADAGPLAGIHAGLFWAAALEPAPRWLLTVPVDMPFLPADLARQFVAQADGVEVVVAATRTDFSPVCALWRLDQLAHLEEAIRIQGARKMTDYLATLSWRRAELRDKPIDPLFNINTAQSLDEAEALAARLGL
jgi:molybdopterin-guanine dinucleotide biosynthesis protein A